MSAQELNSMNPTTEYDKIRLERMEFGKQIHAVHNRVKGKNCTMKHIDKNDTDKLALSQDLEQILSATDLLKELAVAASNNKKKAVPELRSSIDPDGEKYCCDSSVNISSNERREEEEDCAASLLSTKESELFCAQSIPTNFGDEPRGQEKSGDSDERQQNEGKRTIENFKWVDHKGNTGFYTGEVNEHTQPHGYGVHVYDDNNKWHTCYWQNGLPLEHWEPTCLKIRQKDEGHTDFSNSFYEPARRRTKSSIASDIDSEGSLTAIMSLGGMLDVFDELDEEQFGDIMNQAAQQSEKSICSNHNEKKERSNGEQMESPPKLRLGDAALQGDMIVGSQRSEIESLKVHDFAFIQRSDIISWTYAILASKDEESMLFVLNRKGSKKKLLSRDWCKRVRLVNHHRKRANHKKDLEVIAKTHVSQKPQPNAASEDTMPSSVPRRRCHSPTSWPSFVSSQSLSWDGKNPKLLHWQR